MDNEILSFEQGDTFIVFRNKGEGQVVRLFFSHSISTKTICISRLYVDYEYRRIGWGTFIVNHLLEHFKGYKFMVTAFPDSKKYMSSSDLIEFYRGFGFEVIRPNGDGVLMIKEGCIV